MARLIAYLAGLPHHGSPLVFPTCSNPHALPKSIDINIGGLHPSEGKGLVATSLDVEGPKRNETG